MDGPTLHQSGAHVVRVEVAAQDQLFFRRSARTSEAAVSGHLNTQPNPAQSTLDGTEAIREDVEVFHGPYMPSLQNFWHSETDTARAHAAMACPAIYLEPATEADLAITHGLVRPSRRAVTPRKRRRTTD